MSLPLVFDVELDTTAVLERPHASSDNAMVDMGVRCAAFLFSCLLFVMRS